MSIKQDILWRVYLTFLLMTGGAVLIIFQLFRIQVVEGAYWGHLADSLTTFYQTIEAERGNIYSEDGNLLATSVPFYEIRMDVNSTAMRASDFYKNVDSLAISLANLFGYKTAVEYKRMLVNARKSGNRYLLIARKVTYPELQQLKNFPLFRLGRYRGGLIVIPRSERIRPYQMLAERTIGFVSEGGHKVGIEGAYDKYLAGVSGKRLVQRIAGDVVIPINDANEVDPENGKDVVTTLDTYIQDIAQNALLNALIKHNAHHGCVIVMEVKTGKIKAIANLGKTLSGEYKETYNYAIGESTEPGSVFKLVSLIALLEDELVSIDDSIDIHRGSITYYDKVMTDAEAQVGGKISVRQAFEISSNVGISRLVFKNYALKPQAFIEHIRRLKLDIPSGIDIPGEAIPIIKHPDSRHWSGVTLPWMSIGYEVRLTPLQMLVLYNAIANNGKMIRPYLVKEIRDHGNLYKKFVPQTVEKKICSENTLKTLQLLLEGVVENGTARNIRSTEYKIAGKTGTAKIAKDSRGYDKIYQASFVGYFPSDAPQYSCIVVIHAPSSGAYYGSAVAAPVFREIADKLYATTIQRAKEEIGQNRHIPYAHVGYSKDLQTIYHFFGVRVETVSEEKSIKPEWVKPRVEESKVLLETRTIIRGLVPNVVGMGLRDALFLLENSGLQVQIAGDRRGKVRMQSIAPGTKAHKGAVIVIDLS